jgi:hypothetical protein
MKFRFYFVRDRQLQNLKNIYMTCKNWQKNLLVIMKECYAKKKHQENWLSQLANWCKKGGSSKYYFGTIFRLKHLIGSKHAFNFFNKSFGLFWIKISHDLIKMGCNHLGKLDDVVLIKKTFRFKQMSKSKIKMLVRYVYTNVNGFKPTLLTLCQNTFRRPLQLWGFSHSCATA